MWKNAAVIQMVITTMQEKLRPINQKQNLPVVEPPMWMQLIRAKERIRKRDVFQFFLHLCNFCTFVNDAELGISKREIESQLFDTTSLSAAW